MSCWPKKTYIKFGNLVANLKLLRGVSILNIMTGYVIVNHSSAIIHNYAVFAETVKSRRAE